MKPKKPFLPFAIALAGVALFASNSLADIGDTIAASVDRYGEPESVSESSQGTSLSWSLGPYVLRGLYVDGRCIQVGYMAPAGEGLDGFRKLTAKEIGYFLSRAGEKWVEIDLVDATFAGSRRDAEALRFAASARLWIGDGARRATYDMHKGFLLVYVETEQGQGNGRESAGKGAGKSEPSGQ